MNTNHHDDCVALAATDVDRFAMRSTPFAHPPHGCFRRPPTLHDYLTASRVSRGQRNTHDAVVGGCGCGVCARGDQRSSGVCHQSRDGVSLMLVSMRTSRLRWLLHGLQAARRLAGSNHAPPSRQGMMWSASLAVPVHRSPRIWHIRLSRRRMRSRSGFQRRS